MTQQEAVAILFDLMSGKPWSPQEGVTVTAPQNTDFNLHRDGEKIVATWAAPHIAIKASKWGFGITGKLTGVVIYRDRVKALIDGLPDVEFKLT